LKRITTFSKQYALVALLFFIGGALFAQTPPGAPPPPKDSTEVAIQRDSIKLKYPFKSYSKSKLFLSNPTTSEVIYDTETGK